MWRIQSDSAVRPQSGYFWCLTVKMCVLCVCETEAILCVLCVCETVKPSHLLWVGRGGRYSGGLRRHRGAERFIAVKETRSGIREREREGGRTGVPG